MKRAVFAVLFVVSLFGRADADVTIVATTSQNGGRFAPSNVVAVWVEDANGTIVKTLQRWSGIRTRYLIAWNQKAGANDEDAVSGASRTSHVDPLAIRWNLLDRNNALVPDGTYTLRMELADANVSSAAQNRQGTFTFVVGPNPQVQSNLASNGFSGVSIDFKPVVCNNGAVDEGEACDPSVEGSCPALCEATSTDACLVDFLVGSAENCTAECTVRPVTSCLDGDGCCAPGCTANNDDDCAGGAAGPGDAVGGSNDLTGGCSAGGSADLWFALASGLAALTRRRVGRRPQAA